MRPRFFVLVKRHREKAVAGSAAARPHGHDQDLLARDALLESIDAKRARLSTKRSSRGSERPKGAPQWLSTVNRHQHELWSHETVAMLTPE